MAVAEPVPPEETVYQYRVSVASGLVAVSSTGVVFWQNDTVAVTAGAAGVLLTCTVIGVRGPSQLAEDLALT